MRTLKEVISIRTGNELVRVHTFTTNVCRVLIKVLPGRTILVRSLIKGALYGGNEI